MNLRPYQSRAVDAVIQSARAHRSVVLCLPTGAGKTKTASALVERAVARGNPVLWLAHRAELTSQAAEALPGPVSVVQAGHTQVHPDALVTVASIQTLVARGVRPAARVVVLDECHHVTASTWRAVADDYAGAVLVGLTATPQRSDGSPLGDVFRSLVVGAPYSELLAGGWLTECDVVAPARRLSTALAEEPARAYLEHGGGRPALVFTNTVAESEACVLALRTQGVRAAHVDGASDRTEAVSQFRAGSVDVLSSCNVLTEGFDSPRAKVAVIARTCASELVYLQIVGRVLRPHNGERALVLDLTGAVHDHGWPTEDRAYSLTGEAIRRASAAEVAVWQCPACWWCAPSRPQGGRCPRCSERLPEPEPLRLQREKLERQEQERVRQAQLQAAADRLAARSDSPAHWLAREWFGGRARTRFAERFHRWPTSAELRAAEQLRRAS